MILRWLARPAGLAAVVAAWSAGAAGAQVVDVRLGRATAVFEARGGWSRTRGSAFSTEDVSFVERFRLPLSGYIIDPRVWDFSVSLAPVFHQYESSYSDRPGRSRSSAFDASSVFFSRRLVSLSLRASRNWGVGRGTFGVTSENDGSSVVAQARFRHVYFPLLATVTRRRNESVWNSPVVPAPIELDRTVSDLRLEMNNPRLQLSFERSSVADPRAGDEEIRTTGQARHRLFWGHGSSLHTSVRFEGRNGPAAASIFEWGERLEVWHTEQVTSQFNYLKQRWNGRADEIDLGVLGLLTRYDPSPGVNAQIVLSRRTISSGEGEGSSSYQVAPTLSLSRILTPAWRTSLSATVGLRGQSRRSVGSGTWLEALAEEHRVDRTRRFLLEHPGVDPGSIRVWSDGRGILLEPDFDYWVEVSGGRVEIVLLPGGRVEEGGLVVVAYRYHPLGEESGRTTYVNLLGSVGSRHLSVTAGLRQQTGDPLDASGALDATGTSEQWVEVSLESPATGLGQARISADQRIRVYGELRTVSNDLEALWRLPFSGRLRAQLRAGLGRAEDALTAVRSTSWSGDFNLRLTRTLRLDAMFSTYEWSRGAGHPENFINVRSAAVWDWGLFTTQLSGQHSRRRNGADVTSRRWELSVTRTF